MKKTILCWLLALSAIALKSQITPSVSIPDPIPNYDGSYDAFGQGELYYPNGGEVRFATEEQEDAIEDVKYYTMNTYPKRYLLNNNNISLVYSKGDTSTATVDSLQRIDLEWQGSNSTAFLARVDTQNTAVLNYFTQWFDSTGRTDVRGGASIACQSIYNNIDLVYTSNNSGLVMYFIVYPGGNYKDIIMHINGSKANSILGGKLKIEANWEYTTFEKPKMYQYVINSSNVISPVNVCNSSWLSVGSDNYQLHNTSSYSSSLPLIIQIKQANPVTIHTAGLNWSTYFGGSQYEFLTKTHVDANDNLFVGGNSLSPNFPQAQGVIPNTNHSVDASLVKFNNSGKILWSIFIGGSGNEVIHDFDFKGSSVYCVGKTSSSDLVLKIKAGATNTTTFGGSTWDGFIFECNSNVTTGAVISNWLTYFGGNGDEELNACKFDASGNFFVVGESASTNLTDMGPSGSYHIGFNSAQLGSPSTPLSTDAIIAKFNTSSLKTWFTFFGTDALGTNAHNHAGDYFYGLTISGTNVYACGKSGGTNLPNAVNSKLVGGDFDGILVHFSTSGALNNSKFTDGNISNYAVKELWGDIYTVGQAKGSMTTANSGLYYYSGSASGAYDACFSVHDQNLTSTTIHNTFLGGSSDDAAYDLQISTNNLFYIAGGTNSSNFPVTNIGTTYTSTAKGLNDNFLACFQKNSTSIIWSSYLGSDFQESLQYPPYLNSAYDIANSTIAIDSQNELYILGTSNSYSTFPLDEWTGAPVYFQPTKLGYLANDATITRIDVIALNAIVGLKDFENTGFVFGLYPNPTANTISITNPEIANNDLRYVVYDLNGKKLKEGNFKSSDAKNIDVSFLPQGVYVINVSNGKKTFSNKFIKSEH